MLDIKRPELIDYLEGGFGEWALALALALGRLRTHTTPHQRFCFILFFVLFLPPPPCKAGFFY